MSKRLGSRPKIWVSRLRLALRRTHMQLQETAYKDKACGAYAKGLYRDASGGLGFRVWQCKVQPGCDSALAKGTRGLRAEY